MTVKESVEYVEAILDRALYESDYPESFSLLGREWYLFREVFPATLTGATEVMASIVPYPIGGRFLEVGSGAGVIAVTAALSGCKHVTALDINERAVANTKANAERHNVRRTVRTLRSNLFQGLNPSHRFDAIFWNVPWTYVKEPFWCRSMLHRAVFDPDYRGQAEYLACASRFLSSSGRLFIGTSDLGELELLNDMAAAVGLRVEVLRRVRRFEVHRVMEYLLLEMHAA